MARDAPATRPLRTCVGCRRRAPNDELVRVVARDGRLFAGRTLSGRGAWLCRSIEPCLTLAQARNAFGRALRVDLDRDAVDVLRSGLEPGHGPGAHVRG